MEGCEYLIAIAFYAGLYAALTLRLSFITFHMPLPGGGPQDQRKRPLYA